MGFNFPPTIVNGSALEAPVTHILPSSLIGSGLGKNTVWRGDFDIQLADPYTRQRYGLDTLRFGDVVAILDEDGRFGPSVRTGRVTIGVVVHGDSTVSGHGPGVTALLTGPANALRAVIDRNANLAALYGRRPLARPLHYAPLAGQRLRLPSIATCSSGPLEAWPRNKFVP